MIGPRLELRTSQQLVMTPQLQQAIKLLQMSNLELNRFVDEAIESNPLLDRAAEPTPDAERARPDDTGREDTGRDRAGPETPTPDRREPERLSADAALRDGAPDSSAQYETGSETLYDAENPSREGFGDAAPPSQWSSAPGSTRGAGLEAPPIEETLGAETTLLDHIAAQLSLIRAPRTTVNAAMALAADIDEAGYLRIDPEEAARRLGVSDPVLEDAIGLLHQCEPTGLGARSLSECLALQLAEKNRLDPAMQAMLDNLPLLARADFKALSRLCGVDVDEVREMAVEIRRLDPRPGREFTAPPRWPPFPTSSCAAILPPDRGGAGWWS